MRMLVVSTIFALIAPIVFPATVSAEPAFAFSFPVRTLDGSANNLGHVDWGRANTVYLRVAPANYADGVSAMVAGPPARYVSNRVFNDVGQNLFSENHLSQLVWVWGQFMDHDFGLRDQTPAEHAPIAFNTADRLEEFSNDLGSIEFSRTPAAPGTGLSSPRQQINTLSSYIDGSGVYGTTSSRLEWLRAGPVDKDLSNNGARLLLDADGYLPRADARGDAATAPHMDLVSGLVATPARAVVAGDVRANENIALTALHTLFAREHNRIVATLPPRLSAEEKFQIARRVVGAELQYVTYHEFLPALGVRLERYRGYRPNVNAGLSNEFAVVGFRAHSMIHGEFDVTAATGTYSEALLAAFRAEGIGTENAGDTVKLVVPLNVAFGNPDLLQQLGLGTFVTSLAAEPQYKNDEQIDNTLRSILFQIPKPGATDPASCGAPVVNPNCFSGVLDLGAIDIQRGRDHGLPSYNDLRRAYGLDPKRSFTAITGESTDRFPSDAAIDAADPIDDPDILDFVQLRDDRGRLIEPGSPDAQESAIVGIRRTTLAARLRAIYGDVNKLDAFVGMISERHVPGTEFGELQLAIWKRQFEAVRDGDRFFYLNDPVLRPIERQFGIDFHHTLAQIVALNTGVTIQSDAFATEKTRGRSIIHRMRHL